MFCRKLYSLITLLRVITPLKSKRTFRNLNYCKSYILKYWKFFKNCEKYDYQNSFSATKMYLDNFQIKNKVTTIQV